MDTKDAPAGFEVDQDLAFQRRQWRAERVGWAVMALVILAALAGLLGPGPLNEATAGEPGDPVSVEYQRFPRHAAPEMLVKVNLGPDATRDREVRLWVDRTYVDHFRIERIEPEPERVEAGADRLTYVFRVSEPGRPTAVQFHMEPDGYGRQHARLGLDGGPEVAFTQFVYP